MARKGSSTIQEELYPTPDETAREDIDDARLLDLDAEKESPFLRAQKRVPARRSPLPQKTAVRIVWGFAVIVAAALAAIAVSAFYRYGEHSWRFRLNSSEDIEISGLTNVTHAQIMEVMGGDIGRNIFYIPLDQRQKQLEQIPWVETASVMRFTPNRIRIQIHERTPVAFARVGSKIMLVDAGGVLMELSTRKRYSFPVVIGMSSGEPRSTRTPRMKIYNQLIAALDSTGARYSQDLSEVDLSDPEDVKVLTNDPDGAVLIHLGSANYLDRFKIYVTHLREWRQQFQKLESVDLRYDRQIIVNPDLPGAARQPAVTLAAARAAISAGVQPAVLVERAPSKPSAQHVVMSRAAPAKRWQKIIYSAKKSAAASHGKRKPAVSNAALSSKWKPAAVPKKPSPAISKGPSR
jgi:cell division protein FtsQ